MMERLWPARDSSHGSECLRAAPTAFRTLTSPDRLRQPDNLPATLNFTRAHQETHGFASPPHSRFAFSYATVLLKIMPLNSTGAAPLVIKQGWPLLVKNILLLTSSPAKISPAKFSRQTVSRVATRFIIKGGTLTASLTNHPRALSGAVGR